MSHSHQRKASALAASFVITTLSIGGCAKTPEIISPTPKDCHSHKKGTAAHPHENCHNHKAIKPVAPKEPIIIANPPMPYLKGQQNKK